MVYNNGELIRIQSNLDYIDRLHDRTIIKKNNWGSEDEWVILNKNLHKNIDMIKILPYVMRFEDCDIVKSISPTFTVNEYNICYGSDKHTLRRTCEVINGKKEGPELEYFGSGEISRIVYWTKGSREGNETYYFDNGKKRAEYHYTGDMLNGTSRRWNKKGTLISRCTYLNDELDGGYEVWYNNGLIKKEKTYIYGKKEGLVTKYYSNGSIKAKINYSNGMKHGEKIMWHKNGTMLAKYNYAFGKQNGEFKMWHDNKRLRVSCNIINDNISGRYTEYDRNGNIIQDITYRNGKRVLTEGSDSAEQKSDQPKLYL